MTDYATFLRELWKELLRQLVPDEVSVMSLGPKIAHEDAAFSVVYAAVFSAALVGVAASYIAGAWMGAPALARLFGRRWAARLRPGWGLGQREREYVGWVLAISVFIPVVRYLVPFAAGLYRLPLRQLLLFFLPSTFVWTLHYFLMGYWFPDELDALLAGVYQYRKITLVTAVVAAVSYITIRQYMRMKLWMGATSAKHRGELQKEPTA
ncbi:DedA family protein [Brevibacillus agri]|uniref:DedA family protein n=1 Tax=Brevibacillus agri TaxID=51101 RepID=UPI003D19C258